MSTTRPPWVPHDLYPFESRYADVGGARVHYVDEGTGPPLLLLHGNPTWSFLYRDIIRGLRDRYRCFAVATRHPGRFAAFVVCNTWAWPKSDPGTQVFSRLLGGPVGAFLIKRRNVFVERILPGGVRRLTLPEAVMNAYRGPFPDPASRLPVHVFPREILRSIPFLAEVERGLPALRDRPALIVWPTKDVAFREPERRRWEQVFPNHRTVLLPGAGHYIQEDAAEEIVAAIRDWKP